MLDPRLPRLHKAAGEFHRNINKKNFGEIQRDEVLVCILFLVLTIDLPVVPHKAVAEVSKIGNL